MGLHPVVPTTSPYGHAPPQAAGGEPAPTPPRLRGPASGAHPLLLLLHTPTRSCLTETSSLAEGVLAAQREKVLLATGSQGERSQLDFRQTGFIQT